MKNWIKIQEFERLHQAELRKDIINQHGIEAIVINEKDSLFMLGMIGLYVPVKDEKKAVALIADFFGLTKINSFTEEKPILIFQKLLEQAGIPSQIITKTDKRYILDNYELYVENENVERVIPYLTGEKITDWTPVRSCIKVRQAKVNISLLSEKGIQAMVIKQKDSEHHLSEVIIYVKNTDAPKADKILTELNGWMSIKQNLIFTEIAKHEEILASNYIKGIIFKTSDANYDLFVEAGNEEKAIDILNIHREWTLLIKLNSIVKAMFYNEFFADNDIPTAIINEKDSSFVIGEVELHVEKKNKKKAQELLTILQNTNTNTTTI